jgi:hypothetical protein
MLTTEEGVAVVMLGAADAGAEVAAMSPITVTRARTAVSRFIVVASRGNFPLTSARPYSNRGAMIT